MTLPKTPHPLAEIIGAWANGATVQLRTDRRPEWEDLGPPGDENAPSWQTELGIEYRVKPDISDYPETRIEDLASIAYPTRHHATPLLRDVANAAIHHAIESGQVVVPGSVVNAELDPDFQEVKGQKEPDELARRACRSLCEYLGKSRDDVSFEVIQAIILLERNKP